MKEENTAVIDESAGMLYATTGNMYKIDHVFLPVLPELADAEEAVQDISSIVELFGAVYGQGENVGPSCRTTYEVEKINNFPAKIGKIFQEILKRELLTRG
ncbi:hypothetical protein GF359_05045 [candidate division WOR-3 bacterium]|uniref:Uncharacterized protein n=1 Tax=candidate division WOR-3 bacterium TaxID=2052148 RepID=A0A9D5K910_UNCW3|nr:hypothetical protein [candidate division WOR-3 bacterium]MBD3364562.1 hypothetical protein [candidate division WOR-3 bacterium]